MNDLSPLDYVHTLFCPIQSTVTYPQREKIIEGPALDAGEDYSVGRKNDYPTETNDE